MTFCYEVIWKKKLKKQHYSDMYIYYLKAWYFVNFIAHVVYLVLNTNQWAKKRNARIAKLSKGKS